MSSGRTVRSELARAATRPRVFIADIDKTLVKPNYERIESTAHLLDACIADPGCRPAVLSAHDVDMRALCTSGYYLNSALCRGNKLAFDRADMVTRSGSELVAHDAAGRVTHRVPIAASTADAKAEMLVYKGWDNPRSYFADDSGENLRQASAAVHKLHVVDNRLSAMQSQDALDFIHGHGAYSTT